MNVMASLVQTPYLLFIVSMAMFGRIECGYNTSFHWQASDWTPCIYKNTGLCCDCYRTRNVSCVYSSTLQIVPPFYCRKGSLIPPEVKEPCAPCHQDCVLSTWGEWSPCTDVCTPGTRYRTRDVILPPHDGGSLCQSLVEVEQCRDSSLPLCIFTDLIPQYSWHVGDWTSCRTSMNSSDCGEGMRSRRVTCVNKQGNITADDYCRYYLHDSKPISDELCKIPCDCQVTEWLPWGPCSVTCYKSPSNNHGYQIRTRSVIKNQNEGGAACPSLKDTRPCPIKELEKCPRYVWHATHWDECVMADPLHNEAVCGPGLQTRDIYCTIEGDTGLYPETDVLCIQEAMTAADGGAMVKPPARRACQVACPVNCMVGEWENWSSCTQTCGNGGIRIRTRPIVQEKTRGGVECQANNRYEQKPCEPTPCTWWHTGQWSSCYVDSNTSCGDGSQVRSVYCLNALDEVLPDSNCTYIGPEPASKQACRIPCPGQCVLSDWSVWSPCSKTCGIQGGTQFRNRVITNYGSDTKAPCVPESELQQMRVCNQFPCKRFLWQKTPWSECTRMDNATDECGEGTGTRNMVLLCQKDPGYPVADEYCEKAERPSNSEVCSAPCPQDCKLSGWSDWSACSQTCGPNSVKVKVRHVLEWPMYGGKDCPDDPDENGLITRVKSCAKKSLDCLTVSWNATKWSQCRVEGYDRNCGKGLQQRNVTCVDQEGQEVNHGLCFDEGLGPPPNHEHACHVKCPGDCHLSAWSQFTPCSQTCGAHPGVRTRIRDVINWDPNTPLNKHCPDLQDSDLTDAEPCGMIPCMTYSWKTGPWLSCIPHNSVDSRVYTCGEGTQTRHVFCLREDGVYVPDHVCDVMVPMPRRHQMCHVNCTVDCQLSDWSAWSACSLPCGNGLRHRERKILVAPTHGGRSCRHLHDVTVCNERECADFDWQTSEWGPCVPNWNMHCGPGTKTREVNCPAGTEYEKQCQDRKQRPSSKIECYKACSAQSATGDCVMSEWSEFSKCDCRMRNASRTRHRDIVREAMPSAVQCGPITDSEMCDCFTYQLVIGGWTDCQLIKTTDDKTDCGKGIQKRPVNCMRADGVVVHLSNCRLGNLTMGQPCELPCAKDCRVSLYDDWSTCSEPCGVKATKRRHVTIMHPGNIHGRQCPSEGGVQTQMTVCNAVPCYNYTWYRGEWHDCHTDRAGYCGVTSQTRLVDCRRADGATVDDVFCFQDDLYLITSRDQMTNKEKIELDLESERSCGQPCPGDCVVSEWSDFGPCIKNCSHPGTPGVQTRSRAVIQPALGGAPCPWDLIQTRSCARTDALCPLFTWEVGKWSGRDRRKVTCLLQGGLPVDGGCIVDDEPSRDRKCGSSCEPYSDCVDGSCVCDPGFTDASGSCLPEFGCASNEHCFLNNTYCDVMNKECLCFDDTLPKHDLTCAVTGVVGTITDPLEELNQLFIYILIGCLVALLFLGVITIVCMIRTRGRRRRFGRKNQTTSNKLAKIDNLETTPRNNDVMLVDVTAKPDPMKIDKNLSQSWQNAYDPNIVNTHNENEINTEIDRNPPPYMERNLAVNSEDELEDSTDDLSSRPFLTDSERQSSSRGTSYSPDVGAPRLPPRGFPAVVGNNRVVTQEPRHRYGSLGRIRATHNSQSSPSTDSNITSIWVPTNEPKPPEGKQNRFPVNSDIPLEIRTPVVPKRPQTPPEMYENLSSGENVDNSPPPVPRRYTPESPHPLVTDRGIGRPISRRNNTEPVPVQYRNGRTDDNAIAHARPNAVAPSPSHLIPKRGMTESNSAKDLRVQNTTKAQTQDLLSYCDELLADLQRVANS